MATLVNAGLADAGDKLHFHTLHFQPDSSRIDPAYIHEFGRPARRRAAGAAGAMTTVTLNPGNDAYVRDDTYANTAEGNVDAGSLQVKTINVTSYDRGGYLRFTPAVPAGNVVTGATLRRHLNWRSPRQCHPVRVP